MRSSGSTRSPRPKAPIRCAVLVVGDDEPKRCTGRRLIRWGRAAASPRVLGGSTPPLVLDPFAPEPLTLRDRPVAERGGILAVDCSWNRLSERGSWDRRVGAASGVGRRLPLLLATNPQHYGRVQELNTAEALAAALYLLGYVAQSHALLAGFPGGDAFFEVNKARFAAYRRATSSDALRAKERELFGPPASRSRGPRSRTARSSARGGRSSLPDRSRE